MRGEMGKRKKEPERSKNEQWGPSVEPFAAVAVDELGGVHHNVRGNLAQVELFFAVWEPLVDNVRVVELGEVAEHVALLECCSSAT